METRNPAAPVPPVRRTVERVHVQDHGALPLDGGPLQLGGGVEPGRRSRQLQRGQQFVLAERAVHPRTLVGHVPGGRGQPVRKPGKESEIPVGWSGSAQPFHLT